MYQQFRTYFKHTLLTSLIPLSLYALISLSEHWLRLFLSHRDHQNTLERIPFNQDDHYGLQVLVTVLSLFMEAKTLILNGYSSFVSFFFMMALINLTHLAVNLLIPKSEKNKYNSLHDDIWNSPSLKKKNPSLSAMEKGARYQGIIPRVIFYGIFYYCLNFAVWMTSPPFADSPTEPVSLLGTLPITTLPTQRFMEEEQANSDFDLPDLSDIKSLSIGKVLKTLKVNPIDVVLSKDNKLAFVIWHSPTTLKVVDISDDQNPIIIGSLENLAPIGFKKMILSADEKTLFACNSRTFEIIDVSNHQTPTLKARIEDSVEYFEQFASSYLMTMALSSDQTILYYAGIRLQIFNVTNTSSPEILCPFSKEVGMTSFALLPDSKTLLSANKTLDFFDISDPTNPKLSSSYSSPNLTIDSIRLSKSLKKVYAVGTTFNGETAILEEIDLSQRTSLSRYEIGIDQGYFNFNLRIMALSPNETNIIVTGKRIDGFNPHIEIIGFDLVKKRVMTQSDTLFFDTKIFLMIPGTNNIITDSNNQFNIIKLFKEYPNTINFCLTNNSRGNTQFPSGVQFAGTSLDSNFLFTFNDREMIFESYTFTSPIKLLGSFDS